MLRRINGALLLALLIATTTNSIGLALQSPIPDGSIYCYYAHTGGPTQGIEPGVWVEKGQMLATSGDTGYGSGWTYDDPHTVPHLHFACSIYPPLIQESRLNSDLYWDWIDPDPFLHPGWVNPLDVMVEVGFPYGEANPAGNQKRHNGRDYRARYVPLYAVAAGEIVWTQWWPTANESNKTGHGITIVLRIPPDSPAPVENGESLATVLATNENRLPVEANSTVQLEIIDPGVQVQLVQILNGKNGLQVTISGTTVTITNPTNVDLAIFGDNSQGLQIWVEQGDILPQGFFTDSEIKVTSGLEVLSEIVTDDRPITIALGDEKVVGDLYFFIAFGMVGLAISWAGWHLVKGRWKYVFSTIPQVVMLLAVVVVIGPPPYETRKPPLPPQTSSATPETQQVVEETITLTGDEALIAWGEVHGIGKDNLLANVEASSICWSDTEAGKIVPEGSPELCTKVDLLTLLSIDATESTDRDFAFYDPTQPGVMGYSPVESSAESRWGAEKMAQLVPIWDILIQEGMRERYPTAITDVNGNGVYEPALGDHINVYGSKATCIGRSQGLPSSIQIFAWDLVQDPNFMFDPWNDERSSAMFKAAHLAWSYRGSTLLEKRRNAVMRYNPGDAELEWAIASDRLAELGDLPTTMPTVTKTMVQTTVTVSEAMENMGEEDTFYVLYSTELKMTPLEHLVEIARQKRGNPDTTLKMQQFWGRVEVNSCVISWAFAARPCWVTPAEQGGNPQ